MWKRLVFSAVSIGYIIFALVWTLSWRSPAVTIVKGESETLASVTGSSLLQLVNESRRTSGLPLLREDPSLSDIARNRAQDMSSRSYYAHRTPEGTDFTHFMDEANVSYGFACENLDIAFDGVETSYITDWLQSTKGHRECLLSSKATRVGFSTTTMPVSGAPNAGLAVVIFAN